MGAFDYLIYEYYDRTGGSAPSLYKLFKEIFNDTMTRHGFVHQGNVFLRINGENIIQAVTVQALIGYEICASICPAHDVWEKYSIWEKQLSSKRPYWAEYGRLCFKGFEDFPHKNCIRNSDGSIYYTLYPYLPKKDDYFKRTVENLEKALEYMENFYIPQFDKIVDFESYFDWITSDWKERSISDFMITSLDLSYKAYIDGNFDWGRQFLENEHKAYEEETVKSIKSYIAWQSSDEYLKNQKIYGNTSSKMDYETEYNKRMSHYNRVFSERFGKFIESAEKNDVSWIPDFVKERSETALALLKDKYSKLKKVQNTNI